MDLPYLLVMRGGLGNQLFQLCFGTTVTEELKSGFLIRPVIATQHSDIFYFDNLFRYWSHLLAPPNPPRSIILNGYYQDHRLVSRPKVQKFLDRLNWNDNDDLSRYDELDNSIFIHVRGGDYLKNGYREIHHVDLKQYYKNAIATCKGVSHAYVLTNDLEYLGSLDGCFDDIRFTVTRGKNEINDLYLMANCGRGGIAANSTFSWWGLYMDVHRDHLVLPDKWFNDSKMQSSGLYFPEARTVSVSDS
jgi:hypothetical protein